MTVQRKTAITAALVAVLLIAAGAATWFVMTRPVLLETSSQQAFEESVAKAVAQIAQNRRRALEVGIRVYANQWRDSAVLDLATLAQLPMPAVEEVQGLGGMTADQVISTANKILASRFSAIKAEKEREYLALKRELDAQSAAQAAVQMVKLQNVYPAVQGRGLISRLQIDADISNLSPRGLTDIRGRWAVGDASGTFTFGAVGAGEVRRAQYEEFGLDAQAAGAALRAGNVMELRVAQVVFADTGETVTRTGAIEKLEAATKAAQQDLQEVGHAPPSL